MNILPVSNINIQNAPIQRQNRQVYTPSFGITVRKPVKSRVTSQPVYIDTFTPNTVGTQYAGQVDRENERLYSQKSRVFRYVTESIAERLAPLGISYNKKYADLNPLKSGDSTQDKTERTGSFDVPDRIRTTLFSKDFYNLPIYFNELLEKYKSCGFIPTDIEVCMENHKKLIEDYGDKIPEDCIPITSIRKQRTSGIEQVQIRFIEEGEKTPIKHELILIPGYKYAIAKYYESKQIYSNTRQLDKLNFVQKGSQEDRHVMKAKEYIDVIKSILAAEISKPLFAKAKAEDIEGKVKKVSVHMEESDIEMVYRLFDCIKERMNRYYDAANKRAKTVARKEELEKYYEKDYSLLEEIKNNILGIHDDTNKIQKEGAIDFFNNPKCKYTKDPFIKKNKKA